MGEARVLLYAGDSRGCGLEYFGRDADTRFLDSDRPKREFMNDRFAAPLSERQGEIHTVCVGRPFGIDFQAAARRGIHVHVYCNSVDDVYGAIASQLPSREARRSLGLLRRYLHVREPRQTIGRDWSEVRGTKSQRGPGVEIELTGCDYDDLKRRLQTEIHTREKRHTAREHRHSYSFEATIEPLLTALEQVRERYFARTRSPLLVNSWRSRRRARSLRSHLAGDVRADLAVRQR